MLEAGAQFSFGFYNNEAGRYVDLEPRMGSYKLAYGGWNHPTLTVEMKELKQPSLVRLREE